MRSLLFRQFASLSDGLLEIEDRRGRQAFGDPASALRARVLVRDPRFYRAVLLRGSIGAGEAYGDGWWETDDPVALVRIIARNRELGDRLDGPLARLRTFADRWLHLMRRNSKVGSRRNIAAHYDVGNDFFEAFLDPTMTYSCALFESEEQSLEMASRNKIDRLCRKLDLQPDDHLLEIGSGWGELALHAARRYGCRVTTTTISRRQFETTERRIREMGLGDRISVLQRDYRELPALDVSFDKLVSVEMIEAVGLSNLGQFFRVCSDVLRPDGALALQGIVIRDELLDEYRRSVDFIQRHIFPGGALPSSELLDSTAGEQTDLTREHVEDLTPHYATTLARWRSNLRAAWSELRHRSYDERFLRLWEFYLFYCEGGFRERTIGCTQTLWTKPEWNAAPWKRRAEEEAFAC